MIYFPAPNYEYEPNIDIGPYFTASTGSTPANQLVCEVPEASPGDTLLAFVHALYPSSTVFPTAGQGWTGTGMGYGYTPNTGQVTVYSKKATGEDKQLFLRTENQTVLADISVLVMRLKGDVNVLVKDSYYSSGSGSIVADGVSMPNLTLAQRPFIPNYILFGLFGGVVNTQYTSSDTPADHTYLTTIGTANTSALISYIKSTDTSRSLTTTWTPTVGARAATIGYFHADNRAAGDNFAVNTTPVGIASSARHLLLTHPNNHFIHQAKGYEEIYEFTIRIGNYTNTNPSGEAQLGLYDITDGVPGATLCTFTTFNKVIPNSVNRFPITPYRLVPGRKYAVAFRSSLAPTILVGAAYSNNFVLRRSTFVGSQPLQDTWTDDGAPNDNRYAIGASVRFIRPGIESVTSTIPRKFEAAKKPRNPTIDWANPITRGLAVLYVPESSVRGNLVTKQPATDGGRNLRGFLEGLALADQRIEIPFPTTRNGLRQQISLLFFGKLNPGTFQTIISISDTTVTYNDIINLCRNSATSQAWQVQWQYGSKTVAAAHSAAGFWDSNVTAAAFARKRSGSNQFHRFYKNGKFHSDSSALPAFSYTGPNNMFRIGEQSNGGNRVERTYILAIWDRDLTDAELSSVTENPYQLLTDVSTRYYYPESLNNPPIHIRNISDNSIYPGETDIQITGANISSISDIDIGGIILPQEYGKISLPELNSFLGYDIPFGPIQVKARRKK